MGEELFVVIVVVIVVLSTFTATFVIVAVGFIIGCNILDGK